MTKLQEAPESVMREAIEELLAAGQVVEQKVLDIRARTWLNCLAVPGEHLSLQKAKSYWTTAAQAIVGQKVAEKLPDYYIANGIWKVVSDDGQGNRIVEFTDSYGEVKTMNLANSLWKQMSVEDAEDMLDGK